MFIDQLVTFYYLLSRVRSHRSLLAGCSADAEQSRRLSRLVRNLMARRHTAGLCRIIGQLERLGGPAAPSVVVPRLRQRRSASWYAATGFSNRFAICSETLILGRELSTLLSCMHKFYRRCSL